MEDFTLLKNSLIYQMSLGSKELYHSNVWAWLIEQDTDFVKVFFDESILDEYDVLGVARECKHRDLIIWLQKKGYTKEKCYLVIENKIKSLPTKEQLIGYTEDIWNYKLLGAVFTGIINPFGQDVETSKNGVSAVWKFVDYTTISYEIENILSNSRAETIINNSSVILEYSNVVRAISHLLNKELNNSVGKLTYAHDSVINELRFDDLYIKLKGADFISYVRQKANLLPTVEGFYLMIEQTFNNGKATLDFRFSNRKSDNDKWFVIGIQIEGTQYRTLVEKDANRAVSSIDLYLQFKNAWFDKMGKSKSMRKEYCVYHGDYIFVYQYTDINDDNNSYEQLFSNIAKDLQLAKTIIESLPKQEISN